MAQGSMQAIQSKIVMEIITIPTITIPSGAYYTNISSYRPQGYIKALNDEKVGWTEMWSINGSITPSGLIGIQADGRYLYGAGGTTVTNLKLAYFYETD